MTVLPKIVWYRIF